jgi:hypothetical protein
VSCWADDQSGRARGKNRRIASRHKELCKRISVVLSTVYTRCFNKQKNSFQTVNTQSGRLVSRFGCRGYLPGKALKLVGIGSCKRIGDYQMYGYHSILQILKFGNLNLRPVESIAVGISQQPPRKIW